MSEQIKDGGPAFPATNYIVPRDLEERHVAALGKTQGMTLRDYFAAKALQGEMVNATGLGLIEDWRLREMLPGLAGICYAVADAMLAAREAKS